MNFARQFGKFASFRTAALFMPFMLFDYGYRRAQCAQAPKFYRLSTDEELNSLQREFSTLTILEQEQVEYVMAYLRDRTTDTQGFRQYADRVIRILFERALSLEEKVEHSRQSPLGFYVQKSLARKDNEYCVVSILRSGNAFLPEVFKIMPGITVGQILIQRNEETFNANHYYTKLPKDIEKKKVFDNVNQIQIFLVDPMLGTGGSAALAIKVLKEKGVDVSNIVFLNVVGCAEGLKKLYLEYPNLRIITAQIDPELLHSKKFLAPGIGDFGDRYFGTEHD